MRKKKLTKEEREQQKDEPKRLERPLDESDLEALRKHFGQTKNLPK